MKKSSLILVGAGIKFISHLTHEAKVNVEQADLVLYLVNNPVLKKWLHQLNSSCESLDPLYQQHFLRKDCYEAITKYILEKLKENKNICVVLYGHPSVFSQPGLEAVRQAKSLGYFAKILPGISAEDCLFADLLIDPGSCGCNSYETTDFLIHKKNFDTSSHLILWQADAIGVLHNPQNHDNKKGMQKLLNYLIPAYSGNHEVYLYEAAQFPSFEPLIQKIPLMHLPDAKISATTTLYIPPAREPSCDKNIIQSLGMNY